MSVVTKQAELLLELSSSLLMAIRPLDTGLCPGIEGGLPFDFTISIAGPETQKCP